MTCGLGSMWEVGGRASMSRSSRETAWHRSRGAERQPRLSVYSLPCGRSPLTRRGDWLHLAKPVDQASASWPVLSAGFGGPRITSTAIPTTNGSPMASSSMRCCPMPLNAFPRHPGRGGPDPAAVAVRPGLLKRLPASASPEFPCGSARTSVMPLRRLSPPVSTARAAQSPSGRSLFHALAQVWGTVLR